MIQSPQAKKEHTIWRDIRLLDRCMEPHVRGMVKELDQAYTANKTKQWVRVFQTFAFPNTRLASPYEQKRATTAYRSPHHYGLAVDFSAWDLNAGWTHLRGDDLAYLVACARAHALLSGEDGWHMGHVASPVWLDIEPCFALL